jgi:hypothetical protein
VCSSETTHRLPFTTPAITASLSLFRPTAAWQQGDHDIGSRINFGERLRYARVAYGDLETIGLLVCPLITASTCHAELNDTLDRHAYAHRMPQ